MITDFFKATKKLGIGLALGSFLAISASGVFAGSKAIFYEKDFSHLQAKSAQYGAGKVSNKIGGVTFLVYGGNDKLVNTARKVAKRLNAEGIPVGFIKALDRDTIDITMHVDFYTKGGTQYGYSAYDNHKTTPQKTEAGIYEWAMKAYEAEFGNKAVKKPPTNNAPASEKR